MQCRHIIQDQIIKTGEVKSCSVPKQEAEEPLIKRNSTSDSTGAKHTMFINKIKVGLFSNYSTLITLKPEQRESRWWAAYRCR